MVDLWSFGDFSHMLMLQAMFCIRENVHQVGRIKWSNRISYHSPNNFLLTSSSENTVPDDGHRWWLKRRCENLGVKQEIFFEH